jgi:uncharacterized protein (TIRG00374 family)
LLALVVYLAGPEETLEALLRLEPWQVSALLAAAFGVSLFTALAWRAILRGYGHRVSVWLLLRLTIVAFAAGWVIPSGFVAGIPVAAGLLRREGVPFGRGLASFAISRFLELTAYAFLLPVVLLSDVGARSTFRVGTPLLVAGLVLLYLDLRRGWEIGRGVLRVLRRRLPRSTHAALDGALGFCRDVGEFFQGRLVDILPAVVFSFAAIGIAFVRSVLTNHFLALGLSLPEIVVMFAVTVVLMAVPLLPGAVGAYESGMAAAFDLVGRPPADAVAYALAIHATELVVVATGLVLLAHVGVQLLTARRCARRPPAGERRVARGA